VEKEWPQRVGRNRLTRYNVVEWLRLLVEARVLPAAHVSQYARAIRLQIENGQAPWPKES
jgi:hypothetical protein